jgi:hypothetical protein
MAINSTVKKCGKEGKNDTRKEKRGRKEVEEFLQLKRLLERVIDEA